MKIRSRSLRSINVDKEKSNRNKKRKSMNENKGISNRRKNNDVRIEEEYSSDSDASSESGQSNVETNDACTKTVDSTGNDNDKLDIIIKAVMRIEEKHDLLEEEFRNFWTNFQSGHQTTPFGSFVTVTGRNSVSTVTNYVNEYFTSKKEEIRKKLRTLINNHTWATMKFLIDGPRKENDDNQEQTPTAAEKVVLKGIETNHLHIPVGMLKEEYIGKAVEIVTSEYNVIKSEAQGYLQVRWFGKFQL